MGPTDISDRLSSDETDVRVRPAADMRCMISMVDHVTKRTFFRKEIRILRISQQIEEIYRNTADLKEARHQAENFLSRRLRRLFPDMSTEEDGDIKQRSAGIIDTIEQKILEERQAAVAEKRQQDEEKAASKSGGSGGGDDMELTEDEIQKGVQIGRVAMRVAVPRRCAGWRGPYFIFLAGKG